MIDKPFRPTGYALNWKVLSDMPLAVRKDPALRDRSEIQKTTVGAVVEQLLPDLSSNPDAAKLVKVDSSSPAVTTLSTPDTSIVLEKIDSGTGFAATVLGVALEFASQGISRPIFFFYEYDTATQDVIESLRFFVTDGTRIVNEGVTFHAYPGNGFNADVFVDVYEEADAAWVAERSIRHAHVRRWYRRFYEETDSGRFVTLRDDVPIYHHVPDWKLRLQLAKQVANLSVLLGRIQWLVLGCFLLLLVLLFRRC